jgi:hypothetical protein
MARRRGASTLGAVDLPDHLQWAGMNDPQFWDSDERPHGMDRLFAHRRHREARRDFLASLEVCPVGIRPGEFLMAHGFGHNDVGQPKTQHLKY